MTDKPNNRFPCQPKDPCAPWELSTSNDANIIDRYNAEHQKIGAADIYVYKLLGVHEQGLMVDLSGNGAPISGGTATGYYTSSAFFNGDDPCNNSKFWRSSQKGTSDILQHAYIGYNFGVPKLSNGRERYGVDVDIKQHITTIKLQQSSNPKRRSLSIRIERSDDGIKWFGVDIVTAPNNDQLNTISFRSSAPSRYWRLRPLQFTGDTTDFWEVQTLQLIDWAESNLYQTQDEYGWIENRDRDYSNTAIKIKGYYDLFDKDSELMQIGFVLNGGMFYITANFTDIVNRIGRPIVIGDILELPSETQYDPNMNPIKKYLEVTDVGWSTEGYTPGWKPLMVRIVAEPMIAKQETMDIIGDLVGAIDQSGLFTVDNSKYSNIENTGEIVREKASMDVPLRGADSSEIREILPEEAEPYIKMGVNVNKLTVNSQGLYVEDAIPPNGASYTEGTSFPTNPIDKQYHRMIYVGMADNIPARLYRYSTAKSRWIYIESDLRSKYNPQKPTIQQLKNSESAISTRLLGKTDGN